MVEPRHSQERNYWSILTAVAASTCLLATLVGAPTSSKSAEGGLTSVDKGLLEDGELVMKPKNEKRGQLKLFGGQSWQVVDVPIDVAWKAMEDFPKYKRIIPLATESVVKGREGNEVDLAIRQQWGPVDIRYVLQTTLDPDRRVMMFRLDHSKGHDFRAGWAFLRARPWKQSQTLMSFGAMVDIGNGILVSIIRPAVRRNLLRIPTNFKGYVEGEGRERYEP